MGLLLPTVPKLASYDSAVRGATAAAGASLAFGAGLGSTATGGAGTTVVLTTSGAVPALGHVVVGVGWYANGTAATASLAGGGLTWTTDVTDALGLATNYRLSLFSARATSGLASSTALTATFTGASFHRNIAGCYLTGVAAASWEDDDGTATQAATSHAWGAPVTTLTAATAIIGFGWIEWNNNAANTPSAGFTNAVTPFANADTSTAAMVYRVVSSTGTYTAGGDFTDEVGEGRQTTFSVAVAYKA